MSIYTIDIELSGEVFYRHYTTRSTAQASFDRLSKQLSNRMPRVRLFIQESRKRPKLISSVAWRFQFEDDKGE